MIWNPDHHKIIVMGAFEALKKDILTDLAFKLFACTSLQDHRQPTAHSRNTQRRVLHDDTRIDLDHLDHSAAVLAVIATGISTQWQREHGTSQLRELPSFERGLGTHSRLASAQVAAP